MSDRDHDPAANTEMFRAFVDEGNRSPSTERRTGPPLVALVVIGVIGIALLAWLVT